MRHVGKSPPVAAPFEARDFAVRCGLAVFGFRSHVVAVGEQADVPGEAEVVPALPAAGVGHACAGVAEAALAEQRVLLLVVARARDDPRVEPGLLERAQRTPGERLGDELEAADIAFGARVERAFALRDGLALGVERGFGIAGVPAVGAVEGVGVESAAAEQALEEQDIVGEQAVAHDTCTPE